MNRAISFALLVGAVACDAEKAPTREASPTTSASAPATSVTAIVAPSAPSAAPPTTPAVTASVTSTPSAAPSAPSATPSADVLAPSKKSLPSEAEWSTAPEMTMTLSPRLACRTTHLSEYFRVRCSAKGTGGLPTLETLTRVDRRIATETDAITITLPYVESESIAVKLVWRDETAVFVVHGRTTPREGEPFGHFYLWPPKNEQTAPNCPPDTLRGPEDYCLVACTSLPVDTCPSSHRCVTADTDGGVPLCVPNAKKW